MTATTAMTAMTMRTTRRLRPLLTLAMAMALVATATACSGGDSEKDRHNDAGAAGLEIAGVYDIDDPTIEGQVWLGGAVLGSPVGNSWLVRYDNDGNWLVWRASPELTEGAPYFGRTVWTDPAPDGSFYTCTDVEAVESADDAEAAPQSADASDLDGAGCGGEPWLYLTPAQPSALVGTWQSSFGGYEEVTPISFDGLALVRSGGDGALGPDKAGWLVLKNPEDDSFNPGKYAKVAWTGDGDGFAYCYVDFGLDSADLAEASTQSADAGDLDGKGCGGFPWTRLSPQSAIATRGVFATNFGSFEVVDTGRWAGVDVVAFDNAARWAVTQNAWDADWSPSAYNKLVWTSPNDDGELHYCTVTFGQDSVDLARDTTLTADEGDLDGEGCGGFPWTKLTPVLEP